MKLEDVWQKFLNTVSTSVSDYLSVEHLGLLLKHLAGQGKAYSIKCVTVV